ncbi:VOC family protein [Gryllotalpicola daejeonensis]|uniref:VOC family protein n=1 Tax=Gryllotalpicola daejeonensis TaxID=993087 RepID=A0ABP7ZL99_9MICO
MVVGILSSVAFVATVDLDRAEEFYGGVLGLELRDERPFALSAEVGGAQLRVTLVDAVSVAPYTVFGLVVADIESAVDELAGKGVRFTRYDGMDQDDRGIWDSPSGARVAWFLDPDGNNLSLTQAPG